MPDETALFDRLDRWRHLPDYQLERRADVFFSLYLPQVLEAHFNVPIVPTLVPEFPVRLGLIRDSASNQSVKVDYLAMSQDRRSLWLVELKTDSNSRNAVQDENMRRAAQVGPAPLLQGVVAIAQVTRHKQKYGHLLAELASLGLLRLPADLMAHLYPTPRPGLTRLLQSVEVSPEARAMTVHLAYVQPRAQAPEEIGFDTVARVVAGLGDSLSQRFAASLRRWAEPAGSPPPAQLQSNHP